MACGLPQVCSDMGPRKEASVFDFPARNFVRSGGVISGLVLVNGVHKLRYVSFISSLLRAA